MQKYKENTFEETFAALSKFTGDTKCVRSLKDMLINLNSVFVTNAFIKETGKLLTSFRTFFNGIEDTPEKYWLPLFNHYERYIAKNPYFKTKVILSTLIIEDLDNKTKYLSIKSHMDCVVHSLINQLKRDLGIFNLHHKLK